MGFLDPIYDPLYDFNDDGKIDSFEEEEMFFDFRLCLDTLEDEDTNSKLSDDEFDPFDFDPVLDDISELDDDQIQELLDLGIIDRNDVEASIPDYFGDEDTESDFFDDEFDSFDFDPELDDISDLDYDQIQELLDLGIIDRNDVEASIPDYFEDDRGF